MRMMERVLKIYVSLFLSPLSLFTRLMRFLAFKENVILLVNPSKSGGDWWFGRPVGGNNDKGGLFPKAYVEVFTIRMSLLSFFCMCTD